VYTFTAISFHAPENKIKKEKRVRRNFNLTHNLRREVPPPTTTSTTRHYTAIELRIIIKAPFDRHITVLHTHNSLEKEGKKRRRARRKERNLYIDAEN
jgi:hypothetical protein